MAEGGGGFFSGCSRCGCLSFNSAWYNTFGVLLCDACKKDEKLISKGAAKTTFLLTDKDIKALGTLSRTNPQHKNWTPMQLYLQSQVEEVAQRKHGSVEQLEELRHERMEVKLNERLNKRRQAAADAPATGVQGPGDGGGGGSDRAESAAQKRIRARLQAEYAQKPDSHADGAQEERRQQQGMQEEVEQLEDPDIEEI